MKNNVSEWLEEVKKKPDINHLDICCFGEIITYTNEHASEDEHDRYIQLDNRLEKELQKEICTVSNEI